MASRPSRRRGRLTEQQEAAAAELRALREGGGLRTEQHEVHDEADVYEEVDEREFESRTAGDRQQAHDFIEDDEGIGYLNEEEDDDMEEEGQSSKRGRAAGGKDAKKQKLGDGTLPQSMLSNYLRKGAAKSTSKSSKAAKAAAAHVDEEQLMNSMLGDMKTSGRAARGARAQKAAFSSSAYKPSSTRVHDMGEDIGFQAEMGDLPEIEDVDAGPADAAGAAGAQDQVASPGGPNVSGVPTSPPTSPTHSPPKPAGHNAGPTMLQYNQEGQDNTWFSAPAAASGAGSTVAVPSNAASVLDDGSLTMYWYDLHEEKYADPGTVYLFGKVQAPTAPESEEEEPEWISCCVKVSKVDRNMYIIPRKNLRNPSGEDIDEPVSIVDFNDENCVFFEFKRKMEQNRISVDGCVKGTPVPRFCTFEDDDVPRGVHQCLKYKCPPSVSEIPKSARSGMSYCHISGAETTCTEQLLLRRKMMGPCWLTIANAKPSTSPFSWCKMEFHTEGVKNIAVAEEHRNTPPPKLKVMGLSIKTVFNEQKRQNEIVMVGTTAVDGVLADAATPDWEKRTDSRVLLRAPQHRALPLDLRETVREKKMPIDVQPSERALLNCFFARIHRFDPDVVVAHNIMAFDLEILLSRGSENKCANWDRLGRLRRRNHPPKVRAGSNGANLAKYAAGRLLCDTYLSAKDLVRQTTYTLAELCKVQLGVTRDIVESEDIPKHFSDTRNLLGLAHHTAKDTRLVLMLMTHLQIIPLTKQLTNLAGNLWARTLRGGKAERNENLLLHEFYRARHDVDGKPVKFLLPDKKGYSDKSGAPKGRRVRKKAAYAGGLVLEPKKGFYDSMILLLDFNSLYPSIIREYNICFTTITTPEPGEDGEEVLPDIPSDTPKGILPRVIKTLIESRGAVKQELKRAQPGTTKYQQLDIRQMALKLTANSMYGCLGFTFSRFYAKPLAMLITAQGRALLQRAKEITETSLGLEVVYGDTDSIMVNVRSNDYDEALAKGKEVIKKINEGYKAVELDIDGVFSNMLLLKKKKYAAMTISGRDADGKLKYSRKTSGLDMVRRDWCPLSKEVSSYVLDRLLGGRSREDSVENIHTYLRGVGEKIQDQVWEGFVMTKQLTKMPHEYSDAKSQPHVQVAIRMIQANEPVQAGQEIQYIVVEGNTSSIADRSMTPKEFLAAADAKIDFKWYLSTQIHPPITRLCEVIEGTDAARIADCLGLDASKFQATVTYDAGADESSASMNDEERYKACDKLPVACPECNHEGFYCGLKCNAEGTELTAGLKCSDIGGPAGCGGMLAGTAGSGHNRYLCNRITLAVRHYLARYYNSPYQCEECGAETKDVSAGSLYAASGPEAMPCAMPGCQGSMARQFSSHDLYTQLSYYRYLFDHDRQRENLQRKHKETLPRLSHNEMDAMDTVLTEVERFLERSSYSWVDMGKLFSSFSGGASHAPMAVDD